MHGERGGSWGEVVSLNNRHDGSKEGTGGVQVDEAHAVGVKQSHVEALMPHAVPGEPKGEAGQLDSVDHYASCAVDDRDGLFIGNSEIEHVPSLLVESDKVGWCAVEVDAAQQRVSCKPATVRTNVDRVQRGRALPCHPGALAVG